MEKKLVYDVVLMYGENILVKDTGISFTDENEAEKFIETYFGKNGQKEHYVVKPRREKIVYSSVADMELAKKREIEELESQLASLKIEMPFEIEIKKVNDIVLKTKVLMLEKAEAMGATDVGNGNVFVALPNDYNFTTTFENAMFIREKVTEMQMKRALLNNKIREIKEFLGQKKSNSVANESEDQME